MNMKPREYNVCLRGQKRWSFKFYVDGLTTICIVTDLEDKTTRAGVSRLNPIDKLVYGYDLSTGRKHALQNALQNSKLPLEYKRLFFERFFRDHERRDIWNRILQS